MKKTVKIVLIVLGIIFLLFCILIGVGVYNDFKTEDKINREVESIQNLMEATEFDEEAFKKKLNNTVSTGDYYKVERAYKNYLRDYLKINNDIIAFYENISIEKILSAENVKNDGKDFIQSRSTLNNYKSTLDKIKSDYDSMFTEKKVLSYLDIEDDYYVDYYKEIVGEVKQSQTEKELSMYLANSSELLENVIALLQFLSDNKNNWNFQDNKIMFNSQALLDQYNQILQSLLVTENTSSTT